MYTNLVCIESETSGVNSLTKPLRRRGRAQEGSSELVGGKVFSSFVHVHYNLVCIESETSGVQSASNLTKPLRRRGRAPAGSSVLVAGKVCIDRGPLYMYMHTNLVCLESATSGTMRVKRKRYPGVSYLALYNRHG